MGGGCFHRRGGGAYPAMRRGLGAASASSVTERPSTDCFTSVRSAGRGAGGAGQNATEKKEGPSGSPPNPCRRDCRPREPGSEPRD